MTTVVLVRHGRTAWNRTRFLGRRDVPLDAVGISQADAVAQQVPDVLAGMPVVALWSSPLSRAVATALPLAGRLGLAVRRHADLVEQDCGDWEGREKAEVGRKVSLLAADERVPGGESAADVARRLERFRRDAGLTGELPAPTGAVVVVAHHLVLKLLHATLLGHPVEGALARPEYRPAPGSVVRLDLAPAASPA